MKIIIDWLKKNLAFIFAGIFIFCIVICFVSGCNYHKNHFKCPEITTNTIIIHDTIIHKIIDSFPFYIQKTDSIVYRDTIFKDIDTALILKDYFALHYYTRNWQDSLIHVDLKDVVSENRFIENDFNYKILRPQIIINQTLDQSVHYNKYLYFGGDFTFYDMSQSELALLYAFLGGYIGAGYIPYHKGFSFKTGIKLIKFK